MQENGTLYRFSWIDLINSNITNNLYFSGFLKLISQTWIKQHVIPLEFQRPLVKKNLFLHQITIRRFYERIPTFGILITYYHEFKLDFKRIQKIICLCLYSLTNINYQKIYRFKVSTPVNLRSLKGDCLMINSLIFLINDSNPV